MTWRPRCRNVLVVLTGDGRVGLVVPPGEVVVLYPLEVGRLRAALREAVFTNADTECLDAAPITRRSA